jgi:ribosome-binding factor A
MVGHRRNRALSSANTRPIRERSQRQRRVGEALRHALSALLRDGECRDPALHEISITVTEVQISPDLREASVFVMPLGGINATQALAGLERCAGYLRSRVAGAVPLRLAPRLAFSLDPGFDQAARITRLLASPEVRRDLRPRRADEDRRDAG